MPTPEFLSRLNLDAQQIATRLFQAGSTPEVAARGGRKIALLCAATRALRERGIALADLSDSAIRTLCDGVKAAEAEIA